jgi:hypothetical protein
MNLFQVITLPITVVLVIWSFIQLVSGRQPKKFALLEFLVWLAASIAILNPDLTIRVAGFLGIGRGADLVLYMLAIAYLVSIIYVYHRFQRLESHLTKIVRQIALQSAERQVPEENQLEENLAGHDPHRRSAKS